MYQAWHFFQNCSIYRQFGQLILPTGCRFNHYKNKKGKITTIQTKKRFLKKKGIQKENVSNLALSIANFMVSSLLRICIRRMWGSY